MVGLRQAQAFHNDTDRQGQPLAPSERERLLTPYLPREPNRSDRGASILPAKNGSRIHSRKRIRPAMRQLIHSLLYNLIHIIFSIYVRIRQIYHAIGNRVLAVLYHHHRTPELIKKDVKGLQRIPKHLSVILDLPSESGKKDGLESLLSDACELAAWSACAGVSTLSIYERTGILKSSLPRLHHRINRTLISYYGSASRSKPTISLRAPNQPTYSPPNTPERLANGTSRGDGDTVVDSVHHLTILLLDATDGRQMLVDLTKTLADMSQQSKLSPADISQELIDAEISESVMGEPDLLIVFGERVVLDGYPPWQIRLSEIFCAQDNTGGVGYQIFLRALYKYAKADFRVGR